MPIDPNIAMGVRPAEQPNMLGQMAQMMAIRQAQQEYEGSSGVNELARQGVKDPAAYLQHGAVGRKTYESILKGQKDLREAQKLEVDLGVTKIGAFKDQLMANVNDPASAAKWLTAVNSDPQVGKVLSAIPLEDQIAGIPTDPKAFNDWKYKTALKTPEFVKHFVESADAQLKARTDLAQTGMTTAATRRGQDITDARERAKLQQIETAAGPSMISPFDPNAIARPVTQAPWQQPGAPLPTASVQGGTYGVGTPNALPAAVGANAAPVAPQTNMLNAPPVAAAGGYTQAKPKSLFESTYSQAVGKSKGERDIGLVTNATSAAQNLPKLHETLDQLKTSDAITGFGADIVKNIESAKAKFTNDIKAGKKVADTEILNAMLGSDVFPMIQSLGIGARGMDTPAEREFIRGVMTGTINMNKDALIKLTEIRKNIEERAINQYNQNVENGTLNKFFETEGRPPQKMDVPAYTPKTTTTQASGNVRVSLPDGKSISFPNAEAAEKFKKDAGIK